MSPKDLTSKHTAKAIFIQRDRKWENVTEAFDSLNARYGKSLGMGAMTAVAGGMLRDVVINEIPLILRKEVYATPALLGAFIFCVSFIYTGNETLSLILGGSVAFILRGCALRFKWSLPKRAKEAD